MKIQAISNTNFRGLYTDKSAQNGGDWKMEYQPYSWEIKEWSTFGTARQLDVDIYSSNLPDNEKIFTPAQIKKESYYPFEQTIVGKESCHDILGTEFYYTNFDNKIMRNRIDHLEAMNREDSLNVLNKKLDKFMMMKEEALKSLESSFKGHKDNIHNIVLKFHTYKDKFNNQLFTSNSNVKNMISAEDDMEKETFAAFEDFKNYTQIKKSQDDVRKSRVDIAQEAEQLKNAREQGKLIDISRRVYVYDPNKPLWEALQNIESAKEKIVALPHKTISVKDILAAIDAKADTKDIAGKAIKYIDNLIKYKM